MRNIVMFAALAALIASPAYAAEGGGQLDPGRIVQVENNIYVATIENRNTAILVGDGRVMIVETNFERNAETLRGLIASVTPYPVELVVNTHWHGDHIGGNALFAANGAVILAHENTRIRMSEDQVNPVTGNVQLEAQAPEFLPMLTFRDEMTVHWGGQTVDIVHYPDAHTDSDLVLFYPDSNVVFVGGLMEYPQYAGVYSPEGFMAALDDVIARSNADTKIVPWQGPVVGPNELQQWRDIIETVSGNVARLIDSGATIDEIIAARPSAQFDAEWGGGRTPERFARDLYYVLTHGARN